MSTATVDQVIEALRPVEDPELHRSIVDLDMVHDVAVSTQGVSLTITLTIQGCPMRNEIQSRVTTALSPLVGGAPVTINFGVMTEEQRAKVRQMLNGDPRSTAGTNQAHGHAEGRVIPFAQKNSKTRPLLISSGKGGVGKSSVTTNLAVALAARGNTVGVLDADIYGFSIPRMLGADTEPVVIDGMILPIETYGVRCFSMGHVNRENKAIVWRGPMLHKALEQFLTDVFWDEPDYLLIDMPPGTGDIALTLSQRVPLTGAVIVTTPQDIALIDARKAVTMFEKVGVPILGIVENMAVYCCPNCGHVEHIFGADGGRRLAEQFKVDHLGSLPLNLSIREQADAGRPTVVAEPEGEIAALYRQVARTVAVKIAQKAKDFSAKFPTITVSKGT
jgi:ATP-binding protein involved in chromosome partitioning